MLYNNAPGDIRRSSVSFAELCAAMLSNRGGNRSPEHIDITFAELYDQYVEQKYEKSKKKLSNASRGSTRAAFNNCKQLHDKKFVDIRKADLQEVIDTCPLKHSSLELILSLFKGMYSYALQNDIVEKDYSQFVTVVELLGLEGLLLSSSNYNLFSKIEAFGDLSESLFTL